MVTEQLQLALTIAVEVIVPRTKHCAFCGEWHLREAFDADSKTIDGLSYQCRGCPGQPSRKPQRKRRKVIPLGPRPTGPGSWKCCTSCGEWKLHSEFYKQAVTKDGLQYACKDCRRQHDQENRAHIRAYYREWRKANPEKLRVYEQRDRVRHGAKRNAWGRAYYAEHKQELRAKGRAYYAEHCDEIKAKQRQRYAEDEEYREKELIYGRAYYADHKEDYAAYYQAHKERHRAHVKRWGKENPEKIKIYGRRYRARKLNAPGSHTTTEWLALCAQYADACPCCEKPWLEVGAPTLDHVIPITWAGTSDSIANIQPICRSCNSAKGNHRDTDYRR